MAENVSAGRIDAYSWLRAIACVAIVLLHTVYGCISVHTSGLTESSTIVYVSLQSLMMWAVPCFIMVTGALLLDPAREMTIRKIYTKYIWRVLLALIIFSFIYMLYEMIFDGRAFSFKTVWETLVTIFSSQGAWAHIWYLYCLIGLYLLLPVYRIIARHATKAQMQYLLVIYVIFRSILVLLRGAGIDSGFYIHVSTIYPFYLFLGYYFAKYWKKSVLRDLILTLCGTALIIVSVWARYHHGLAWLSNAYNYNGIPTIMMAIGIYGLVRSIRVAPESPAHQVLMLVDQHSFGIYLIHLIWIRLFVKSIGWNPLRLGLFGILLLFVMTLVLSFGLSFGLKKLPVFRKIL
ncbi:MAG: acyltransferase family protein [Firmicutes bacterium]|nr:acyltransferase family protein [Bacillota bacterium]